jgi:hypothetical protein
MRLPLARKLLDDGDRRFVKDIWLGEGAGPWLDGVLSIVLGWEKTDLKRTFGYIDKLRDEIQKLHDSK